MLDIEKIRELVEMMVTNDLVEISLRDGEEEVNLRRPNANLGGVLAEQMVRPGNPGVAADQGVPPSAASPSAESEDAGLVEIESPMVGTFYSAPSPDAPVFVRAGQSIHADTVVCIVEAMKVFNEIKSEVAGTIERILVKNAEPVEYGQPLFLVRP